MLAPIDREQYLMGHIPYRLQSLRFCYRVCDMNRVPHADYGEELAIGEFIHLDDNNRFFINPIIESGLIYSRVLLAFLGIGRDRKTGELRQTTKPKDPSDICLSDFGLPLVAVSEAVSGFSYASPLEVGAAFRHVIETANKTVAHLTSGPATPGSFPSLRLTCRAVVDLVIRHLYIPLGEDCIVTPITETTNAA
jgi:hypothetical protein